MMDRQHLVTCWFETNQPHHISYEVVAEMVDAPVAKKLSLDIQNIL